MGYYVGMPSRNKVKDYDVDSYYHVYNRGVNKKAIFKDDQDYAVFLNLLKRYLGAEEQKDSSGRIYEKLGEEIELLAFCMMPNHFHLFIYQREDWRALEALMRRITTSYSMYFNKKYKRVGHLFQDSYKASRVDNEAYLQHITRYIHLNPKNYKHYEWSSIDYYTGKKSVDWVKTDRVLGLFKDKNEYIKFIDDFDDYNDTKELVDLYLAG